MKTVILGDARMDFQADISTALMLESYPVNIIPAKTTDEVYSQAARQRDAIIVLSDSILAEYDGAQLQGRTVYGYASTPSSIPLFQQNGIACIGLHKTSSSLLNAISQNTIPVMTAPVTPIKQKDIPPTAPEPPITTQAPPVMSAPTPTPTPVPAPSPAQSAQTTPLAPSAPSGTAPGIPFAMTPEMMAMFAQMMAQMQGQVPTPPPGTAQSAASPAVGAGNTIPPSEPTPPQEQTAGTSMREKKAMAAEIEMDKAIDNDLMAGALAQVHKTKTITIYAAKGGVGKTTIASELATCLALTSNGRRKFRVCLVDYNIDFGDVATMLDLDESGANMTYWATEIQEHLDCGKEVPEIQYTRKQMETNYLQCVKDTGLYVLVAPIMHEDSMHIHSAELDVMLENIIQNGEFDYVICDTGNNTRDSSVIALDKSDYVLLVATQDVTTANCNTAALKVLRDSGFNTDRVRLIVNNVMPSRETGISVQEVEETFSMYKCLCRIKRTPDIIKANNIGQPLVYKPNSEYTKQIQRIVRFVTGDVVPDLPTADESKTGFFSRLFKKG